MGSVTFRLLPRFLRRAWQPTLTDGAAELTITFQVHELVKQLPPESQRRCLQHVAEILQENADQRAAFQAALAEQSLTCERLAREG